VSAAIGWTKAGVNAAALAAVGVIFHHSGAATQVIAIAVTFSTIHLAVGIIALFILFRGILRVPMAPILAPALPALPSGLVAALVGWSVRPWVSHMHPLVALSVTATVAISSAAIVLLIFDREVSAACLRALRRRRSARA
jgi:hypothetical protein